MLADSLLQPNSQPLAPYNVLGLSTKGQNVCRSEGLVVRTFPGPGAPEFPQADVISHHNFPCDVRHAPCETARLARALQLASTAPRVPESQSLGPTPSGRQWAPSPSGGHCGQLSLSLSTWRDLVGMEAYPGPIVLCSRHSTRLALVMKVT